MKVAINSGMNHSLTVEQLFLFFSSKSIIDLKLRVWIPPFFHDEDVYVTYLRDHSSSRLPNISIIITCRHDIPNGASRHTSCLPAP